MPYFHKGQRPLGSIKPARVWP